jgi:hypothetical protein
MQVMLRSKHASVEHERALQLTVLSAWVMAMHV